MTSAASTGRTDTPQTGTRGVGTPHPGSILIKSTTDNPMRYNPATDRAISIDEIAAQCRAAILKADHDRQLDRIADRLYDEVLATARWENDLLIAA